MSSRRILSRRDLLTLQGLAPPPSVGAPRSLVHIASLLVHAIPERIDAARAAIASIPDAELHATAHPGKFAVVLECADEGAVADCVNALHAAPGVLTVSIVSHLIEDADALDEEMNDGSDSSPVPED